MSEKESSHMIVCPITNQEYNGLNKFVGIWSCGHVYSQKAMKEIKNSNKCLVCEKEFRPEDLIDLNLTP